MIWPSLDQITPEPLPRPSAWPVCTTTVERRSFSATSPKPTTFSPELELEPEPVGDILFSSVRTLGDFDGAFLKRAATNEFHGERFADRLAAEMRLNVFE